MDRREALKAMVAAGGSGAILSGCGASGKAGVVPMGEVDSRAAGEGPMPSIFLAHGSPFLLDDAAWVGELRSWAVAIRKPAAVLMVSAHWEEKPVTLGATRTVPLVYDFYDFPARYYETKYEAPGAPDLARRVRALLEPTQSVAEDPARGLDHGAYVPLVAMYPDASVPVLQLSLPTMDTPTLFELGKALAPLRHEGVLIVGSGFLSHNLASFDRDPAAGPPAWAKEFDDWAADVLVRKDVDALLDYRYAAPGVKKALPTQEHFVPVVVALGAAVDSKGPVTFPIRGFVGGSLTRRSVHFA